MQKSREGKKAAENKCVIARAAKEQGFIALIANRQTEADELLGRARTASDEAEADYRDASQALERALNIDGSRADLRAAMADILVGRVLLTESDFVPRLRADLLNRLAVYDESGERQRRLKCPGHLIIDSARPGITVRIARFKLNRQNRWEAQALEPMGTTPLSQIELEPGSYLLSLSAAGYATFQKPVFIENGNQEKVTAEMLPATRE
jgi:multidrug efflux pump subunit AcrA (membrane-fusion protein)